MSEQTVLSVLDSDVATGFDLLEKGETIMVAMTKTGPFMCQIATPETVAIRHDVETAAAGGR